MTEKFLTLRLPSGDKLPTVVRQIPPYSDSLNLAEAFIVQRKKMDPRTCEIHYLAGLAGKILSAREKTCAETWEKAEEIAIFHLQQAGAPVTPGTRLATDHAAGNARNYTL